MSKKGTFYWVGSGMLSGISFLSLGIWVFMRAFVLTAYDIAHAQSQAPTDTDSYVGPVGAFIDKLSYAVLVIVIIFAILGLITAKRARAH